MKHLIFGLVGSSGSGKSALTIEVAKQLSDRVVILKSLTTRSKRDSEDDLFYQFIDREEILRLKNLGQLLQITEYAGNYYATDRNYVDALLERKHGICALVEESVRAFESAGYRVVTIKITPRHYQPRADAARLAADATRATLPFRFDTEIINSFEEGGKERAIKNLINFINDFEKQIK